MLVVVEQGVEKVDFIKADIEGAERERNITMDINGLKEKLIRGPHWFFEISVGVYHGLRDLKGFFRIHRDLSEYQRENHRSTFTYHRKYRCFVDESRESAGMTNAYYWQDLWAAEKIIERHPKIHYDIGSRIDGFIAHLQAAKIQINLIDIRPLKTILPYVGFTQADATNLEGIPDKSVESISALCSLEHFGLGRYGDPVDPEACFKAFSAIQRVLKRGGTAYISVPIGKEHVEFNAHRIFYAKTVIDAFSECELVSLSCNTLEKEMQLIEMKDIHKFDDEMDNRGGRFGLFEFVKK